MDFYFCTLSNRTIVYKGMLRSAVVGAFFKDLVDPAFETAFAIYHRRFSTNTTPKWPLAQPMRFLGHNGEINTLQVRAPTRAARASAPGARSGGAGRAPPALWRCGRWACAPPALATAALHHHRPWRLGLASCRATSTGWPRASTSSSTRCGPAGRSSSRRCATPPSRTLPTWTTWPSCWCARALSRRRP
jgi:hypothetical protein